MKKMDRRRNFPIQKSRLKAPVVAENMKALALEPIPLGIDGGCQWLRGPARERVFCGHATIHGSAWCQHHHDRVWVQAS